MSKTPDQIVDHEDAQQQSLLSFLRYKTNRRALMRPAANQLQQLETVFYDLLERRLLDGEGAQLDGVGDIVGEPRRGRADSAYKIRLAVRILLNVSSGTPEEILAMIRLLAGDDLGWQEFYPAFFTVAAYDVDTTELALEAANIVQLARGAGIGADFLFSPVPGSMVFSFNEGAAQGWNAGIWPHTIAPGYALTPYAYFTPFAANAIGISSTITSMAYGNGTLVAIGSGAATLIVSHDDGATWSNKSAQTSGSLAEVAFGGGTFVIVGAGGIWTSTDGDTWTKQTDTFGGSSIECCAFGDVAGIGPIWIAGGNLGKVSVSLDNGVTWIAQTSGFANLIRTAIYAGGQFVITAGAGQLATSPFGTGYTVRGVGSDNYNELIYANGKYVAVGLNGVCRTSTDGATWTTRTLNLGTETIYNVVATSYGFVAHASNGRLAFSPDGITWTEQETKVTTHLSGTGVSLNGMFFIPAGGDILMSSNGTDWVRYPVSGYTTVEAFAFGTKVLVMANGITVFSTNYF